MFKDPWSFVFALADAQVQALETIMAMTQNTQEARVETIEHAIPVAMTACGTPAPVHREDEAMSASHHRRVFDQGELAPAEDEPAQCAPLVPAEVLKPSPKPKRAAAKASPSVALEDDKDGVDAGEEEADDGEGWLTLARSQSTPIRFKGHCVVEAHHSARQGLGAQLEIFVRAAGGWMIALNLDHSGLGRDHTALVHRVNTYEEGADWLEAQRIGHLVQGLAEMEDGRRNAMDLLCLSRALEQIYHDLVGQVLYHWRG